MQSVFRIYYFCNLIALLLPAVSLASPEKVYHCKEDKTGTMSWQPGGLFKKKGLTSHTVIDTKDPTQITFTVTDYKASLKLGSQITDLRKASENTFIDESSSKYTSIWTVILGNGSDIPTYVIQQTAFKSSGPMVVSSAFKCE